MLSLVNKTTRASVCRFEKENDRRVKKKCHDAMDSSPILYQASCSAALFGYDEPLRELLLFHPTVATQWFTLASIGGHFSTMKMLYKRRFFFPKYATIPFDDDANEKIKTTDGDGDTLTGILNIAERAACFKLASGYGRLDFLKWAHAKETKKYGRRHCSFVHLTSMYINAMIGAAESGYLDTLDWLYNIFPFGSVYDKKKDETTSLDSKRETISSKPSREWTKKYTVEVMTPLTRVAASKGRIPILEWITEKIKSNPDFMTNVDAIMCHEAACKNKVSVLRWMKERADEYHDHIKLMALYNNHFDVLKWVLERKFPHAPRDAPDVMIVAIMGHVKLLSRMLTIGYTLDDSCFENACATSIWNKRWHLLHWLRKNFRHLRWNHESIRSLMGEQGAPKSELAWLNNDQKRSILS